MVECANNRKIAGSWPWILRIREAWGVLRTLRRRGLRERLGIAWAEFINPVPHFRRVEVHIELHEVPRPAQEEKHEVPAEEPSAGVLVEH